MRIVRTYSQSSGLRPRLTYLLYTLCLRLIADLNEVVTQGGSRLSQVTVLLGINSENIQAHFDVNKCVILSTSSPENMVGQSMFAIADLILSFWPFT